jgi:hypothetical protein
METKTSRIKPPSQSPWGMSMVESLLALPILFFFGLVIVQIGLLWHAKFALTNAAMIAAQQGSFSNGSHQAIRDGVIRGLFPLFGRAKTPAELGSELLKSSLEVSRGIALGWIRWEVLSPTQQSFQDWGERADPLLSPGASLSDTEIPAHGVAGLADRRKPKTGVLEFYQGLPVGIASGQTLLEANNLKVYLQVGIPLQMPMAGQLMARALSLWAGCGFGLTRPSRPIGLIEFGKDADPSRFHPSIQCRALSNFDDQGRWVPRWPVSASALVQMQSNARKSLMVLRDRQQSPTKKGS